LGSRKVVRVTSHQIADEIAREEILDPALVKEVLLALGPVVARHLKNGEDVVLERFGKFRAITYTGGSGVSNLPRTSVFFTKSRNVKEILMEQEEGMDKYAVDETAGHTSEELEKKAQAGCPLCGRTPDRHGSTLLCPAHGSEPFEG
jgi:nucleoid DNA-binding protein